MKQAVKALVNLVFLVLAFPMALLCGFGRISEAFTFFAQLCSLIPGLPGDYFRVAFYWQTLRSCSLHSRISMGSFFVNRNVSIGEHVYIGAYCILGSCEIGPHCLIASSVQIMPGRRQHPRRADGTLETNTQEAAPLKIGAHCWIGAAAIVMENVGDKSTVAAGAVVTRAVPPNTIVAGTPARPLTPRGQTHE